MNLVDSVAILVLFSHITHTSQFCWQSSAANTSRCLVQWTSLVTPNTILLAVPCCRALLPSDPRDRSYIGSGGIPREYVDWCYRGRPPNPYPKVLHRKLSYRWKGLIKTYRCVEKIYLFCNRYYLKNVLKLWHLTYGILNDALLTSVAVVMSVGRWTIGRWEIIRVRFESRHWVTFFGVDLSSGWGTRVWDHASHHYGFSRSIFFLHLFTFFWWLSAWVMLMRACIFYPQSSPSSSWTHFCVTPALETDGQSEWCVVQI